MASKKSNKATITDNLPALRIGCRVRCSDDGVAGRIVWANAVSLKIKWDDGEQVTWRRDSLTERPIDILDADDEQHNATMATATEVEQSASTELPQAQPANAAQDAEAASTKPATGNEATPTEPLTLATEASQEQTAPIVGDKTAEDLAKPKRRQKESPTPKEKKRSALDAAAQVLAEENKPMNCRDMIAAMATRGYWSSPKGRTPAGTLYSAMLREITVKGSSGRFVKAERGKFALANGQKGV